MSSSSDQEDLQMQEDSSDEEVQSDVAEEEDVESDEEEVVKEATAIGASSSGSDEDDDEVADKKVVPNKKRETHKIQRNKLEKIKQDVNDKYEKRKSLQLFICFPEKLPTDINEFNKKVKSVSDLIVVGYKPRQKNARFCLVDFASTQDRDKALDQLTKAKDENKLVVSLPQFEEDKFAQSLIDKRVKKLNRVKAKKLLKKKYMKASMGDLNSTIRVLNIPDGASIAQIKETIPGAVDVHNLKPASKKFAGTSTAIVTMSSPEDASNTATKTLTLGNNKLILTLNIFNKEQLKIKKAGNDTAAKQKQDKKAPDANGNAKKNKNKNDKGNGTEVALEEKLKSPKKREISEDVEVKVPKKKAKVSEDGPEVNEVPQKKEAPQKKSPNVKKSKQANNVPKENKKTPQIKFKSAPNNSGLGKQQQPHKQKKGGKSAAK